MNETYVTMIGNAVEDPVRRTTRSGTPFVTFRIASTVRRRRPDGEYEDAGTSFVNVMAFRQLARNIADSVSKGQPLVVNGRLRVNRWQREERSGVSVEIDANSVGHDLTRGVSKFTKVLPLRLEQGSNPARVPGEDRWEGAGQGGRFEGTAVREVAPYDPDGPAADIDLSGCVELPDGVELSHIMDLLGDDDPSGGGNLSEGVGMTDDIDDGPLDLGGAGGLTSRLTG